MKKFILGLAALMAFGLAGCGGGTTSITDSSSQTAEFTAEDYTKAVTKIFDYDVVTVSGKTGLVPDYETSLSGDNNDYLVVTMNQLYTIRNKGDITVSLEWEWDITDKAFSKKLADITDDENHKILYFNYSSEADIEGLEVTAKASAGGQTSSATYKIKLLKQNIVFEELASIAELYEIQDNGYFRFLDDSGKITGNVNAEGTKQRYYYCSVPGKVVYVAADSNFAIMSDGELSVYLFKISDFKLQVGQYIKVYGEAAIYYGAFQLSYISKVETLEDHSAIVEPAEATATTVDTILTSYYQVSDKHMYKVALSGLTFVGFFDKNGDPASAIDPNARGVIRFAQDGKNIDVAYDYHTKIGDALNSALKGGTTFNIEGHLIFNNGDNNNKAFSKTATTWQILPVSETAIVAA